MFRHRYWEAAYVQTQILGSCLCLDTDNGKLILEGVEALTRMNLKAM